MARYVRRALLVTLVAVMMVSMVPVSASGVVAGVTGTITVEGTGAPIAGANVLLRDIDHNQVAETVTDASGHYAFAGTLLTPGESYWIWAYGTGYEYASASFQWTGAPVVEDLQLVPMLALAQGTVTDLDTGDPIADAEVWAYAWEDGADEPAWPITSVSTGADGSYTIYVRTANIGDYWYTVNVYASAHEPFIGDETNGFTYTGTPAVRDAALSAAVPIAAGTIIDADTGLPLADVQIDAWVRESAYDAFLIGSAYTNEDGTYVIYDEYGVPQSGDCIDLDVDLGGYRPLVGSATNGMTYTGTTLAFDAALHPYLLLAVEDGAADVTFDRFVPCTSSAYSGGSYTYGRWTGTRIETQFTGSSIAWIGPMQPSYGKADVYIDNVKWATVDCYAPAGSASLSETLLTIGEDDGLDYGTHTLSIRLTGARNAASTGNVVVVDKFVVRTTSESPECTRANESAGTFSGAWIPTASTTYTGGTYRYSRWAGAKISYTFTGTRIAWIGPRALNYGRAEVWIDGVKKATVSQYGALGWRYRVWESAALAAGQHTIEIRVLGTKDAASANTIVVVDGFDVKP